MVVDSVKNVIPLLLVDGNARLGLNLKNVANNPAARIGGFVLHCGSAVALFLIITLFPVLIAPALAIVVSVAVVN